MSKDPSGNGCWVLAGGGKAPISKLETPVNGGHCPVTLHLADTGCDFSKPSFFVKLMTVLIESVSFLNEPHGLLKGEPVLQSHRN